MSLRRLLQRELLLFSPHDEGLRQYNDSMMVVQKW
jgi:hypothetical protein